MVAVRKKTAGSREACGCIGHGRIMIAERRVKRWLSHTLSTGLALGDPVAAMVRRRIIQEKAPLRDIYYDRYIAVLTGIPQGPEAVLALGSGTGFLANFVPGLIKGEVLPIPDGSIVMDGLAVPLAHGTLRRAVMTNVCHHLSHPC